MNWKNSVKLINIELLKQRALTTIFILFGLYPIIPNKLESKIVILFVGISFLCNAINSKEKYRISIKKLLITVVPYFLLVLSLIYTSNIEQGIKKLTTMSSLVIFPLVFSISYSGESKDKLKVYFKNFASVFFTSSVVYIIIALYFLSIYRHPNFSNKDANFIRNAVIDIPYIGEHSIYLSIYFFIAIIFGLYFLKEYKLNRILKLSTYLGLIIITLFLLALMSKAVIIASIIVLIYSLARKYLVWLLLIGFTSGILFFSLVPKENNRFYELFNKETYHSIKESNSTNIRINILKCSINKIFENPLIGYGIGDVQNELDNCYSTKDFKFIKGLYNSHNQYLFFILSAGVLGLLALILYLSYIFKIALDIDNRLLITVCLFYSIVFLFENVLSRQSGVILFSFLINFLILLKKEEIN